MDLLKGVANSNRTNKKKRTIKYTIFKESYTYSLTLLKKSSNINNNNYPNSVYAFINDTTFLNLEIINFCISFYYK